MNLKSRNKRSVEFSMSSMTDIVFLLLIFFMLTSTLVSPNALKLLLPKSSGQTLAKQTSSVSIDEHLQYYFDNEPVDISQLESLISTAMAGDSEATLVLNAHKTVPIDNVVQVMSIANKLKVKMIIATDPK
jgi:biopolymer transport protein ExbD